MGKSSRQKTSQKPIKVSQPKDRFGLIVGISVAVVIVLIVGLVAWLNLKEDQASTTEASTSTPAGTQYDGIVITPTGVADIKPSPIDTKFEASEYNSDLNNLSTYIDYACPHCEEFETANIEQIEGWMNDGALDTFTVHPLAFLSDYSLNAANAISCVATYSPENTLKAHKLLMNAQTTSPNPKGIVSMFKENGITIDEEFNSCVRGGKYDNFVLAATEKAQLGPLPAVEAVNTKVTGTPYIFVNGVRYTNNPADAALFAEFTQQVINGTFTSDGSTAVTPDITESN